MSIDIHVGGEYTVADIEKNEDRFLGAEIKVHFTPKSFAQMILGNVTEDDYGYTNLIPVGMVNGGAVVESDMRVEVLDIKANGMPAAKGTVVRIGEGSGAITLVAESFLRRLRMGSSGKFSASGFTPGPGLGQRQRRRAFRFMSRSLPGRRLVSEYEGLIGAGWA